MTMILTCLTKNYIVQASDRRFTYPTTSLPPNNEANKALIYKNHFAFSFTGLAELSIPPAPSLATIAWAAEQLRQKNTLGEAVSYLRHQTTAIITSLPKYRYPPQIKFLDLVGAGFVGAEKGKPEDRHPARIIISNWVQQDGRYPRTPPARPNTPFSLRYYFLDKHADFDLFVAGQSLDPIREGVLRQNIGGCLKNSVGAEVIGRLLTQAIQETSQVNHLVGGDVMCTFVPRITDPSSTMIHLGGFLLDLPPASNPQTATLPVNYDPFVPFPDFDKPRVIYASKDGSIPPSYTPINVFPGLVVSPVKMSGLSLQFGGQATQDQEENT